MCSEIVKSRYIEKNIFSILCSFEYSPLIINNLILYFKIADQCNIFSKSINLSYKMEFSSGSIHFVKNPLIWKMWAHIANVLIRLLFWCINSYLSCLKASAFTSGVSTECSKSAPSGPGKEKPTCTVKVQLLQIVTGNYSYFENRRKYKNIY